MVDESEDIFEVYICQVYIFVGEFYVFEGYCDCLYLSRGITLWSESFLAKVDYSVLFSVAYK